MGSWKRSERNGEVRKTVAPGTKSPCVCGNSKKSDVRMRKRDALRAKNSNFQLCIHARNLDYMNFSTRIGVSDDVTDVTKYD